jgi:DNA-binding transcriptional MerR regulator
MGDRDARKDLLPIGEVSRKANLSPRQLRYYHQIGILPPALVDADTGRRFYSRLQAETAELVALLRSVDMPLKDIQALLEHPPADTVRAIFERHRERVASRLDQAHEMLATIERILEEDAGLPPPHRQPYAWSQFTPGAQAALILAEHVAGSRDRDSVGTDDLLLGLVSAQAGRAATILRDMGVTAAVIEAALSRLPAMASPQASGASASDRPRVPDASVKRVVEIALDRMRPASRSRRVATGHLLLAILEEGKGTGAGVLYQMGVDADRVRRELERLRLERGDEDV